MIKLAVIVVVSLLLIIFLKDVKREFALILTIACSVILFIFISNDFFSVFEKIYALSSGIGNVNSYVSLMLKILGISLISQFVVDLCRDAGENALASQTEIASKVIILIMTLPLFETVINIIVGLLK